MDGMIATKRTANAQIAANRPCKERPQLDAPTRPSPVKNADGSPAMDRADMTHPLTPREKVAKEIVDRTGVGTLGLTYEASQFVALGIADAILTALASGSGDHAELILMANAALEIYSDDVLVVGGTRRIHADNIILYVKNGVDALIAENAALRDKTKKLGLAVLSWSETATEQLEHRDEAERKLAEAVQVIRDVDRAARQAASMNDAGYAVTVERTAMHIYGITDAFLLSKEAERG